MKIIVRKMPQMVLDKSFEQLNGKYEICFNGNAMETFMKSIEMSENDDCLNLEDDIVLCDNFLEKVNEVIAQYPDKIISFFTLKKRPMGINIERGKTFCMNQCVYIPKKRNKALLKYQPVWMKSKRGIENPTGYDYLMGDLMDLLNETYVLYQPSLVQHMEMKSRINPKRSSKRQSKTFIK